MRIDYEPFVHPADSECLTALERGSRCLADVLREFDSHYDETPGSETRRQVLVEVDSRQCPDIHKMLADVVRKLGIRAPGLFIELSERNYVRLDGCDTPDVILSSAFADSASDDECKAAIAGACGHILCRHAKLRAVERILRSAVGCHGGVVDFAESMALAIMPGETYRMLIQGLGGVIRKFLADDEKTLMDAYARWCCASEFSADRVAAYVMGSVEPVIRAQIRLAGGAGLAGSIDLERLSTPWKNDQPVVDLAYLKAIMEEFQLPMQAMLLLRLRCSEMRRWYAAERKGLPPFAFQGVRLKWFDKQ